MNIETRKNILRPARSLSTILSTAFFIMSVVILLVSGGLQLFFNIQAQQQALSDQQKIIAQGAADTVSSYIHENFSILSTSVYLAHPNTLPVVEQNQFMLSLLANQAAFRQFAIYDAQDNLSSSATRTQIASTKKITSYVTVDIFAKTQRVQSYIGALYFDSATHEPLVLMAVPITNALGYFQGTFVGELKLASTWNLVAQIKVGNSGYAYVVDRQGKLLAYKDNARALKGENVSSIKSVNEFINTPTSTITVGTGLYTGINGSQVVGTYVPLGTPDWAVVTELPWQEAYRQSIQNGLVSIGILFALTGLAAAAGVLVARRLANPLIELTGTATAITAGDLNQRTNVKGGREIETLAGAFNNMTNQLQGLIGGLEERVAERTRGLENKSLELQNVAQIVREISNIQDTDILLDRITKLIKERFGYYHIGIFLVDDNDEYAVLTAAGGEAGQLMLASKHKLKVGETGIVGYVAKTGEPRVALDVGTDAVHFQNPLLPYTRSEMALPLKIANRIIGILDIQSDKTNAFDQSSVSIMQIVTDQLSLGIERTQFLKGMQENAAALEMTLQENTSRSWRNFMEQKQGFVGYKYDGVSIEPISKQALENPQGIHERTSLISSKREIEKTGNSMAFPIMLRGQTLGILNLQFQSAEISQETTKLVEDAANRLALALENARLVAEAQQRAERERVIGQITTRMRETLDVETILKTAVKEMRQSLALREAEVRLQLVEEGRPAEVKP